MIMKKLFLTLAMAVMMTTSTYAAKFQMNAPSSNDNLLLNSPFIIKWTSSDKTNNLKLILRRNGALVGNIVENLPPSTTSYNWTVGKYLGGMTTASPESEYTIRVQTMNNGPYADSVAFPISGGGKGTLQTSHAKATKGLPMTNLGPQAATKKALEKLTVNRPAENDSLHLGETIRIHWTMPTPLGGLVRITLLNPNESVVQTIAASAENKGAYDWVIPNSTPFGSYRVKVQVLNSDVSDKSGLFKIAEKPSIAPGAFKILRVLSPTQNQVIKPPNQPIHVIWETEYPGPFTGEICKKNSVGHWVPVLRAFWEQSFTPVSSSGGLSRYVLDDYLNEVEPAVPDGWYRFRVSLGDGKGLGAYSPDFRVERGTVQKQVILEAVEIVDRYAETVIAQNPVKGPPGAWLASKPGLSRVGFVLYIDDTFNYHKEELFVFRSKVRFPLEPYKGKTIAKATLRLVSQASWINPLRQNTNVACGGKLIFLIQPWIVNVGNALNASGVQLATIPNQLECTFDVTQPIKDTVRKSGGFPNLGFLLTSVIEDFPSHYTPDGCMTWYKAYLILEVLENL